MATASFSVSITATAGTPEQAQVLRLAGLRRFVRTTTPRVTAGMLDGGESTEEVDPQTLDEAALLPLAEAALQRFVRECIVADVAKDADGVRAGIVAQGEAQAQALSVVAEVIP